MAKPGALQLKKAWQAVLNAIDVSPLSDQSLVDPHDVLLDLDLEFALLPVLSPRLVQRTQELLVIPSRLRLILLDRYEAVVGFVH